MSATLLPLFETLTASSHVAPVIVHVSVSTGSLWAVGLISGGTILLGVIVTEVLVRIRERRRSLDAALLEMQTVATGHMGGILKGTPLATTVAAYGNFTAAVIRVRTIARRPLRNAQAIRDECDEILKRLYVEKARMERDGTPPKLGPIIGSRINGLVMGSRGSPIEKINDAVRAAGFDPDQFGPMADSGLDPV